MVKLNLLIKMYQHGGGSVVIWAFSSQILLKSLGKLATQEEKSKKNEGGTQETCWVVPSSASTSFSPNTNDMSPTQRGSCDHRLHLWALPVFFQAWVTKSNTRSDIKNLFRRAVPVFLQSLNPANESPAVKASGRPAHPLVWTSLRRQDELWSSSILSRFCHLCFQRSWPLTDKELRSGWGRRMNESLPLPPLYIPPLSLSSPLPRFGFYPRLRGCACARVHVCTQQQEYILAAAKQKEPAYCFWITSLEKPTKAPFS